MGTIYISPVVEPKCSAHRYGCRSRPQRAIGASPAICTTRARFVFVILCPLYHLLLFFFPLPKFFLLRSTHAFKRSARHALGTQSVSRWELCQDHLRHQRHRGCCRVLLLEVFPRPRCGGRRKPLLESARGDASALLGLVAANITPQKNTGRGSITAVSRWRARCHCRSFLGVQDLHIRGLKECTRD